VVFGHVLQVLDVVAGPGVLTRPVQPPPRLAVLFIAGDSVVPGDVPTLVIDPPVQCARRDGLASRLGVLGGVGYPDLDELAAHDSSLVISRFLGLQPALPRRRQGRDGRHVRERVSIAPCT
jgi:hypothetical protein